jgi:hypothetical protein
MMGSKKPIDGLVLMARPGTHDATLAHSFNHTDGICPKCSSKNHHIIFCLPGQSNLPRVSGCEVDGEHLHRQCGSCGYPWVERGYDQLLLSQEEGWALVDSQLVAALACVADSHGGITANEDAVNSYRGWTIRLLRDPVHRRITITAEPTPETGKPAHPELRPEGRDPSAA